MLPPAAIDVTNVDVGPYCNEPGPGGIDSYIYGGDGTSLTLVFNSDTDTVFGGFLLEVMSVGKRTCMEWREGGGEGRVGEKGWGEGRVGEKGWGDGRVGEKGWGRKGGGNGRGGLHLSKSELKKRKNIK